MLGISGFSLQGEINEKCNGWFQKLLLLECGCSL